MTEQTTRQRIEAATLHELKCWPDPFDALVRGEKTCEFRKNDRDYQAGDILQLRRFQPVGQVYTGEIQQFKVTHVLRNGFGLPEGYCVLSLETNSAELAAKDAEIARLRQAADDFVEIIDSVGLIQLSSGVQLGATSWYVKASDSLEHLRAALTTPKGRP